MNRHQRRAQHQDSTTPYRASVAAAPKDAKARNALACALVAQGKLAEASEQFAHALSLMPELLDQYGQIVATLLQVNPTLRGCLARLQGGFPAAAPLDAWIARDDLSAIGRDPLFRMLLELSPVREAGLERFLTLARRSLLGDGLGARATERSEKTILEFCCALARQCFLNEYAFAIASEEQKQVERLQGQLTAELTGGRQVPGIWVALLASYVPLASVVAAQRLLERSWPSAVRAVLRQHLIEPAEEQEWRHTIPHLTPIDDRVSRLVRSQYEENPYPRWVAPLSPRESMRVEAYLRQQFPASDFSWSREGGQVDILVAGCGTGQQSITTARRFTGAKVLAIDLSLSSLAYAKRVSEAAGLQNIEYAQADILELGKLGRTFDVIEASGVLHHMAKPMEGWRVLLSLLRPTGVMNVALYSKIGRQIVQKAREFVADKGYRPSSDDIRRLRQDLLLTPLRAVEQWNDYYTTSECRDLLFHVQEHQITIQEIARFIADERLTFIGFLTSPQIADAYRRRFPNDISLTDLSSWSSFEEESPRTFASMYQFWVQKN